MRGSRHFIFANLKAGKPLESIVGFLLTATGLAET